MNTLPISVAKFRFIFLFAIALAGGCAVAPPEPYPQSSPRSSYPVSKKHDAAPPVPSEPPIDAAPATRRRAVPSTVDRPIPAPPSPRPQDAAGAQRAPVQPTAPFPVQVCDGGGCFGPGGDRYSGGVGNIYLDNNGKPCQRMGSWMQCN
ncbi:MAG: hypothetical protein A3I66_22840 [Burkholderiales bacterium RIFCSPLOWO2_02_FULL_57_36]|nr:MAG: hypothetical protein A3I66_22840 [Burkholderiales bacterium RIFCSPLOWO2_02_FULL_57_36]